MFAAPLLRAQTKPRVAIQLDGPDDAQRLELETRLRAELAIAGFEAVLVDAKEASDGTSLSQRARTTSSFAAISVARRGGLGAEVWVADRVTGKTVRREVSFDAGSTDAAAIFAIRAVELLHASLLELSEPHPSRGEVAAPRTIVEWVAPPPSPPPSVSREARIGIAIAAGPGGVPATASPMLSFGWRPVSNWVGGVDAWGPGLTTITQREGSARIDQELLCVWARVEPLHTAGFAPYGKLGLGAHHLGAQGSAVTGYTGRSAHVWSAAAVLGVGLRFGGTGPVVVSAGVDAVVLSPRPGVQFGNHTVATAGRPTLVAQTTVGVQW